MNLGTLKNTLVATVLVSSLLLTSCGSEAKRGTSMDLTGKKVTVNYFKAQAEMEVKSITTDFFPENKKVLSDPKKDGNQFVRLEVAFKNTGKEAFKVNFTQARLDGKEAKDAMQSSLINKGNVTDRLENKELAAGESTSGALYFEVPASETKDTLILSYKGYEGSEAKMFSVPLK